MLSWIAILIRIGVSCEAVMFGRKISQEHQFLEASLAQVRLR